jgi:hypothetical protein
MSEAINPIVGDNTISKMVKAKIIQARQTGLYIQLKNVHDKLRPDGTNWNSRNMSSAKTKEDVDGIVRHILSGGMLPAIEVQPRAEGGVQKVDGYCRAAAYAIADASGEGELWIPIVPFIGTELEALARISTSNKDSKINPLEQLDNYNRIREQLIIDGNEKPSLQDIADIVGVSRQYVDQILKLNALDDAGKALVGEGKVTVAIAVKAVRADAENASALLEEAAKNAQAQGKAKATAKTEKVAKPVGPSAKLMLDIHQIGMNLRENIGKDAASLAEKFLKGDIKGDTPITLPVRDVAMLLAALREGERQTEEAKAKAAAKADKAKQLPMDTSPDLGDIPPDSDPDSDLTDEEQDEADALRALAEQEELDSMPEIPDDEPEHEEQDDNAFAFLG